MITQQKNELKPCPFCGCEVHINRINFYQVKIHGAHDLDCIFANMFYTTFFNDEEEAKEAWNRRTNDESKT